ncbi:MAG: hypothetical protein Q8P66_01705 [Candidatus Colwellbacteria bacterium]|nr:hypothetical protein [Candidatus Colwellbacteria bacterium]
MRRSRVIILIVLVIVIITAAITFLLSKKGAEEPPIVIPDNTENPFTGKMLPPDKEIIKRQMVGHLGDGGTITETPRFNIYYFAPDVFQVEIKITNIADVRDEAITWFKDKGFSENDICKLPVTFYLNPEVARKLEGSGVSFNTLPDFCR